MPAPLTTELIESDAWRTLSCHARLFICFLMLDIMGGGENGRLTAPHHRLRSFGIASRHSGPAIREADDHGLVDWRPGDGWGLANTFGLTFLPRYDGTRPSNRWRQYREPPSNVVPFRRPSLTTTGRL
jgi:hypothetical protein